MPLAIDVDLLREVTAASLSAYDAMKRVRTLADEGGRVVALSEDLLRRAGFLYFLGSDLSRAHASGGSARIMEDTVQAYMDIQRAHADLKGALYDLMMQYVEGEEWDNAQFILTALREIDDNYRDTQELSDRLVAMKVRGIFNAGILHMEQGAWQEAIDIFQDIKMASPEDKQIWRDYLSAYVTRACAGGCDTGPVLTLLAGREAAINAVSALSTCIEWYQQGYNKPRHPSHHYYLSMVGHTLAGISGLYPEAEQKKRKKAREE